MHNAINTTKLNPTKQIKEDLATLQLPSIPMIISLGVATQEARQNERAELLKHQSKLEKEINEDYIELRVLSGAPIEPQSMRGHGFFDHLRIESHKIEEEISNPKGNK
ncbi:MAG: hypothetical protein COC24_002095 [Alphaproteobacteria bacterium]|nr:hypothetical protein [Alphaproteobacteria bacterium]